MGVGSAVSTFDVTALREWGAQAYLIAEAGVNHEGDLGRAREMVAAAAEAGLDAVKFQTYKAERIATRSSAAYWDRSKEASASQFELFRRYDRFGEREYAELFDECRRHGITFLTTPFDVDCVDWLDDLLVAYKIASADLTNVPLLRRVARTRKPVLLSTGASTIGEIDEAVDLLRGEGAQEVVLLHCTLSYPTVTSDAAIGSLVHLAKVFPDLVLGYSDHTMPEDSPAAISSAYILGARVIEKHYTLDKTLPGNDHWHSFDPRDFARLREELERLRRLLGEPRKIVLDSERPARRHARRSLVTRGAIAAGAVFTAASLDVKRPGTGIEPGFFDDIVGRVATRDLDDDTTLTWDMVGPALIEEGGASV